MITEEVGNKLEDTAVSTEISNDTDCIMAYNYSTDENLQNVSMPKSMSKLIANENQSPEDVVLSGANNTLSHDALESDIYPSLNLKSHVVTNHNSLISSGLLNQKETSINNLKRIKYLQTVILEKCNKNQVNDDFWNCRLELMDLYHNIIVNDTQLAIENRLVQKMWKFCVKIELEYYQHILASTKSSNNKQASPAGTSRYSHQKCVPREVHDSTNTSINICFDEETLDTSKNNHLSRLDQHTAEVNDKLSSTNTKLMDDRFKSENVSVANDERWQKTKYRQFLEECRGFYLNLLMMIKCKSVCHCAVSNSFNSGNTTNCTICDDNGNINSTVFGSDGHNQIGQSIILDSLVSDPLTKLCPNEMMPKFKTINYDGNFTNKENTSGSRNQRAVYAIIHSILVNIGDIARYLQQFSDAYRCYLHATQVIPSLGQPYNQLAILYQQSTHHGQNGTKHDCSFVALKSTNKDFSRNISDAERLLNLVFYYVRALSVPVSFPLAFQNLHRFTKSLTEIKCDTDKHPGTMLLSKTLLSNRKVICENSDDLITLFVHIFANIYNSIVECAFSNSIENSNDSILRRNNTMANEGNNSDEKNNDDDDDDDDDERNPPIECSLASAIQKLKASLVPVLTKHTISSEILIQISAICIFLLDQTMKRNCSKQGNSFCRHKNYIDNVTNNSNSNGNANKMLPFCTALISSFLDQLIEVAAMPINSELTLNRHDVLPAAYILLLYLLCTETNETKEESLNDNIAKTHFHKRKHIIEMNSVFWLNLGRLLSSFNVFDQDLSNGSFLHRQANYLLTEERFLRSFSPLNPAISKAIKIIESPLHGRYNASDQAETINSIDNDDTYTNGKYCVMNLCEKDERQLRKTRMVKLLESYLIERRESYRNLSPLETAIRLRNAIPLKILFIPTSIPNDYSGVQMKINDKKRRFIEDNTSLMKQVTFQSDLDLLQKMQCIKDINFSNACNVNQKLDYPMSKSSHSSDGNQIGEYQNQVCTPAISAMNTANTWILSNQNLLPSIYDRSRINDRSPILNKNWHNQNQIDVRSFHANVLTSPNSMLQSTYQNPFCCNSTVNTSTYDEKAAILPKNNFVHPLLQSQTGNNNSPMWASCVNYIAPTETNYQPVLSQALIDKFNNMPFKLHQTKCSKSSQCIYFNQQQRHQ